LWAHTLSNEPTTINRESFREMAGAGRFRRGKAKKREGLEADKREKSVLGGREKKEDMTGGMQANLPEDWVGENAKI